MNLLSGAYNRISYQTKVKIKLMKPTKTRLFIIGIVVMLVGMACGLSLPETTIEQLPDISNIVEKIPLDEFVRNYTFQPDFLGKRKRERGNKNEKLVNKAIATAEEHVKRKELFSAEFEYKNALKLDEDNLRANFGIGNVYLEMGESEKAKEIFVKISKTEAIFEEKNKHFFNECAIQLRKQKLYDEAIEYYQKGIELSPNDENLYFNTARALFEKGDHEKAKESIFKVISINPSHKEAKAFLNYMDQKRMEDSEE